jgi:hypothetical protein
MTAGICLTFDRVEFKIRSVTGLLLLAAMTSSIQIGLLLLLIALLEFVDNKRKCVRIVSWLF